ncbi:pyrimidodiazepine synthase-like isoform X2 [Macrosteles quadrilineatus]|uniref:pyrimidodiazepine synthase-like isoform X2 n=1 Tax=Macrosteles quadrilineatus TaxID=74068 RepID=UPI0023E22051|nr:pyrimidodiazepine synthase-like isoform X2 [Macrosteles quadrilineatus]
MPEHLTIGSAEPPLSPGKLRLYGMRFCPYDHRVHLVLLAKNILHDVVWINLKNKPEWYVKKIPTAKVPALAIGEKCLWESLIIADYLDEQYTERPLHSSNTLQKAKDRILIESFGPISGAFYKFIMTKPTPTTEEFEVVVREVKVFDLELANRGTPFFGGSQPGMVDYMIWPWFERFGAAKIVFGEQFDMTSKYQAEIPHIVPWVDKMLKDQVVQKHLLDFSKHSMFIKSFVSGEPDYTIPT